MMVTRAAYNVAVLEGKITPAQASALAKAERGEKLGMEERGAISSLVAKGYISREEAKSITEGKIALRFPSPTPTPTWKETTVTGSIMEKGYVWKTGARLHMEPKIYEMPPKEQEKVLASTTSIRGFGAGFVSIAEQWGSLIGKPTPPGPISGVIGLATGRPEAMQEYAETPLEYKIGQLPAMVLESALITVGVGKATQLVKKAPYVARTTARLSQAYQASRLAKTVHKVGMKIKYSEPFYTVSKAPSRVGTFFAKRGATGQIERQLAWGGKKWLVPSGFETWATVKEAHKFVGYPILTGKYVGYGVIEVTKLTPYQQIMFGIEKGMYPAMGGLSATQVPQFAKIDKKGWLPRTLAFPAGFEPARTGLTPLVVGLGVSTLFKTKPKRKTRPITPTLQVPRVERISLEREKERFRSLELTAPKRKERAISVPKLRLPQIFKQPQLPKLKTLTVQKQAQRTSQIMRGPPQKTKQVFKTPFQLSQAFGKKRKRKRYGEEWFFKLHPLATPKQVFKSFMGSSKRKR